MLSQIGRRSDILLQKNKAAPVKPDDIDFSPAAPVITLQNVYSAAHQISCHCFLPESARLSFIHLTFFHKMTDEASAVNRRRSHGLQCLDMLF